MKYKLYLDMDGVISNCNKHYGAFFNEKSWYDHAIRRGCRRESEQNVIDSGLDFWINMPWMPEGKDLWNFLKPYKPIILSSPNIFKDAIEGKRIWIERELGEDIANSAIIEHEKTKYAAPNAILIDDYEKNISRWVEAGAIGIFHVSLKQTIKEFKKLIGI